MVFWVFNRAVYLLSTNGLKQKTRTPAGRSLFTLVVIEIVMLIKYFLVSAINARARLEYMFFPGCIFAASVEINYLDALGWLPHRDDQKRTVGGFWKHLVMAFCFFAQGIGFSATFGGMETAPCM